MRTKRLTRKVFMLMEPELYDAVQAWGETQGMDYSEAARRLLRQALGMEALKDPSAYLAVYRQMQAEREEIMAKQRPFGRTVHIDGQNFVFNPAPAPLFLSKEEKALWNQTSVTFQIAEARASAARKYGDDASAYQQEIAACQKLLAQLSSM